MDYTLLISAQVLRLAPDLKRTAAVNGLFVVKNVAAKTYLRVTPAQWTLLALFEEPRLVPAALDRAIRDRLCLPLGEFYELILKAARARILVPLDATVPKVEASDWPGRLRPEPLAWPLAALFLVGLVLSFAFRPALPTGVLSVVIGLVIWSATMSLAAYVRGCLIRGAGGDVYHPRWDWTAFPPRFRIDSSDALMLSTRAQDILAVTEPALLAAAAGILTWNRPEWAFIPLLGLIIEIRPAFGGRFSSIIRLGHEHRQSDAEHSFIFPPNSGAKARWRSLVRSLRETNTWVRFLYGVIWTLAIVYLAARLTDTPPWTLAFWEANGLRVAVAVGGSVLAMLLGFLVWEMVQFGRVRGRSWLQGWRRWRSRWFGSRQLALSEPARLQAFAAAPLLRSLDAGQQQNLARSMEPAHFGAWKPLTMFEGESAQRVALIVSGRVIVRRQLSRWRTKRVQVLGPGDMLGLHDVADPNRGNYRLRTATPVALLTADRAATSTLILGRVTRAPFGNMVLKVPFLRAVSLCRNWHAQAVERFAQLSVLTEYPDGHIIFAEGQSVDRFYIVFEGDAVVAGGGREISVVRVGQFFGEISLLQNSTANATVTARRGLRCLEIARMEFLRFVTHNHAVALELERVSAERLGRPIFPVRQSDFRAI